MADIGTCISGLDGLETSVDNIDSTTTDIETSVQIIDDAVAIEGAVATKGLMVMTDNGASGTYLQSESGILKSVVTARARTPSITHRSAIAVVDKLAVVTTPSAKAKGFYSCA